MSHPRPGFNVCVTLDSPHLRGRGTWPRYKGYVIAMEYVLKRDREMMEEQWRQWRKDYPDTKMYPLPLHVAEWAETKKRLEAQGK